MKEPDRLQEERKKDRKEKGGKCREEGIPNEEKKREKQLDFLFFPGRLAIMTVVSVLLLDGSTYFS